MKISSSFSQMYPDVLIIRPGRSEDSSSPLSPTAEQGNWLMIGLVVLSFRHLFGDRSARICQPVQSRQAILRLPRRDPHADAEAGYPPAHRFQYDHRYLERSLVTFLMCVVQYLLQVTATIDPKPEQIFVVHHLLNSPITEW